MCRNIKVLANFEPPATHDEIRASALQFVRKLSGTTKPSKANEAAFNQAVDDVTAIAHRLIDSLVTNAPPRNREVEAKKGRERAVRRGRPVAQMPTGGASPAWRGEPGRWSAAHDDLEVVHGQVAPNEVSIVFGIEHCLLRRRAGESLHGVHRLPERHHEELRVRVRPVAERTTQEQRTEVAGCFGE
jgi:hypothetical protein